MSGAFDELSIVFITELKRRVRSRLFWIATVGGIVAIAVLIEAPAFFVSAGQSSSSNIVLAGTPALRAPAAALLDGAKNFDVVARLDALPRRVNAAYLRAHGNAGAAVALEQRARRLSIDTYRRHLSAFDGRQLREDLAPLAIAIGTGLPPARVAATAVIAHRTHPIDQKFSDSGTAMFAHGIAFGLIFMLYLAIILASQGVMASVAEEKTSRIAEILMATIAARNLLAGKVLAAAVVAAIQLGLWLLTAIVLTRLAISTVPWWQTAVAAAIDAATVVVCFWAAGKIYRVGMLLYGRLPSPRQIIAALRT